MINEPYLSLIIPVYNVEDYIVACAESIAIQPQDNIEVIWVDDGGNDDSISKLTAFIDANQLKHWQILHKVNGGLSSARNFGLAKAKGNFIWFIDSDDVIDSKAITTIVACLKNNSLDTLIIGYQRFTDEVPRSFASSDEIPTVVKESGTDFLKAIFTRQRESYSWSFVTRRALYESHMIRFPDGRNYEDMATTYKIAYFSNDVGVITQKLYDYRDRPGSISNDAATKNTKDLFLNIDECYQFFEKHPSVVFAASFADFAAYSALLAYQQSFKQEDLLELKRVYRQLDWGKITKKYQIAYRLAMWHLLKPIQAIRKALDR